MGGSEVLYTVPPKKQLVIQYINGRGHVAPGSSAWFQINDDTDVDSGQWALDANKQGTGGVISGPDRDNYAISNPAQIYVPAGHVLRFVFLRTSNAASSLARVFVSGYLAPSP